MKRKTDVKYNNDLNGKIVPPKFAEQEWNIFMSILADFRATMLIDPNFRTNPRKKYQVSEVKKFFGSAYNQYALGYITLQMANRLIKQGFKWTYDTYNEKLKTEAMVTQFVAIFSTFKVEVEREPRDPEFPRLLSLEVKMNPDFVYLIEEIEKNFTQFEIGEFKKVGGQYTKNLYRLLKQYSGGNGWAEFKWDDFMDKMHIPKNYSQSNIDQRILKPAILELIKPITLFDQERIPFENLTYTKIKGKGRGQGGNVIAIRFEFKPQRKSLEPAENTQKPQEPSAIPAPAQEPKSQEPAQESTGKGKGTQMLEALHAKLSAPKFTADEVQKIIKDYLDKGLINNQDEALKITDIHNDDEKLYVYFVNREDTKGDGYLKTFESIAHFKNYIKGFTLI